MSRKLTNATENVDQAVPENQSSAHTPDAYTDREKRDRDLIYEIAHEYTREGVSDAIADAMIWKGFIRKPTHGELVHILKNWSDGSIIANLKAAGLSRDSDFLNTVKFGWDENRMECYLDALGSESMHGHSCWEIARKEGQWIGTTTHSPLLATGGSYRYVLFELVKITYNVFGTDDKGRPI